MKRESLNVRSSEPRTSANPATPPAANFSLESWVSLGALYTPDQMTAVWRKAARDLIFEFISPFSLENGERTLSYLGLVPQFGGPKGTLVIVAFHADDHIRIARQQGYGYSCISQHSEGSERERFIDILSDWRWSGSPDTAPPWYTGEPWTL